MSNIDEVKEKTKKEVILWFKRIYTLTGNIYTWFWIIRALFFRDETSFEDYLMWFFLTASFYWFIIEHDEIFIKNQKNNKRK